jgi:hypothetical protein
MNIKYQIAMIGNQYLIAEMADGIYYFLFDFTEENLEQHPITELYYLGGENSKNLTIGQKYKLRQLLYAEKREDKRVKVWV